MESIKKLYSLLTRKQKLYFFIVLILSVITAIFEVTGVASIFPFFDLITNTEKYSNNFLIDFIKNTFNKSGDDLIYFAGTTVLILVLLTTILKTFTSYLQIKYARNIEYNFSKRLISSYLKQNYEWFLNKNSSDLGKNLLQEIANCFSIVLNLLKIITYVSLFFLSFAYFINAKVAIKFLLFFH